MRKCEFRLLNVQLNIKANSSGLKLKTELELGLVFPVLFSVSENTYLCSGSSLNEHALTGISSLMRGSVQARIFWGVECWHLLQQGRFKQIRELSSFALLFRRSTRSKLQAAQLVGGSCVPCTGHQAVQLLETSTHSMEGPIAAPTSYSEEHCLNHRDVTQKDSRLCFGFSEV